MPKKEISPETKLEFEEIRASMAIEGYDVSDANLDRAIQRYLNDPEVEELPKIKARAKQEGRSFFELLNEELGLVGASPKDDE